MRIAGLIAVAALAGCATQQAPARETPSQAEAQAGVQADALVGRWRVEMLYSETAPPSTTELVISEAGDGRLAGSFYQSDFLHANYSLRGDVLAFGAVTTDGAAPYGHSGRLVGDMIEGQTLSEGRGFLVIWTARRMN
jgi:hypothetical protein